MRSGRAPPARRPPNRSPAPGRLIRGLAGAFWQLGRLPPPQLSALPLFGPRLILSDVRHRFQRAVLLAWLEPTLYACVFNV